MGGESTRVSYYEQAAFFIVLLNGSFHNVGNTCYLNAVLQALLVIDPFVESLRKLSTRVEGYLSDE